MRAAVQFILDADAAARINELCAPLIGLPDLETEQGLGEVPHVTFALYPDLPTDVLSNQKLAEFAATVEPISITLKTLAVVPGPKSMVALLPVVTEPLLALHRRYYDAFPELQAHCSPGGKPGQFTPFVTLALNIAGADNLRHVFDAVADRIQPITARFAALRYQAVRPVKILYDGSLRA